MQLALVTPPASALVTLAQAKMHLRVEHAVENDYITDLIATAEAMVTGRDGWTGKAGLSQTWRLTRRDFPSLSMLRLPLPPLVSVTHIKYYDGANALQTFSSANYAVMTGDTPGFIELLATIGWPTTYSRPDAVEIQFVCGFTDAASAPPGIKQAVLIVLAALYAGRGDMGAVVIPHALRRLLGAHKCWSPDDWA
jgi:uncharacterized phiE125 gp8 family phage protein